MHSMENSGVGSGGGWEYREGGEGCGKVPTMPCMCLSVWEGGMVGVVGEGRKAHANAGSPKLPQN